MGPVFACLSTDMMAAAGFGAVGGLGLSLLQEKGLEMPHWNKETGVNFADLGFIADIHIGALAAVITYALNPPAETLKLVSATITAGVGGSGILKGYINGTAARKTPTGLRSFGNSPGKRRKARMWLLAWRSWNIPIRWQCAVGGPGKSGYGDF